MSDSADGNVLRSASAGVIIGFDVIARAIAISSAIFAGSLAAGLASGAMLMILASLIATLTLVLSEKSNWPIIGAVQQAPLAVLAPFFFALAALPDGPQSSEIATATAFAILGGTALVTGVAIILIYVMRLERLVRLMPYPVSTGFLAATGALLILAALMSALPSESRSIATLLDPPAISRWPLALTILFAAVITVLYALLRERGLVYGIFGGAILFYVVLSAQGMSIGDARGLGLLPKPATGGPALAPGPWLFAMIDLEVLRAALPSILAAALVSIFGLMLNLVGLEMVLGRDLDTRGAILTSGVSNIAAGAIGGTTAYPSATSTVTANEMRADHPAFNIAALATLAVGFLVVGNVVDQFPGFLGSGFLLFIGISVIWRWFISLRQTLSDKLISAAIVAVSVVFGMLQAIGVGVLAASLLFAVSYGRLPVITRISDLSARRSAVDRGPRETRRLDRQAHEVVTMRLDGFLFFGSIEQIVTEVRARLEDATAPRVIILDCERVRGVDSATLVALAKLRNLADRHGAQIIIAGAAGEVSATLDSQDIAPGDAGPLIRAPSVDAALAMAEDRLIAGLPGMKNEDAQSTLTEVLGDAALVKRLLARMKKRSLRAGETLIVEGQTTGEVYLIDSGNLGIFTPRPEGGVPLRLRSLRAGAFVGEIASYAGLPRTADVIAETDSTVYAIDPEDLDALAEDDPTLLAAWHRLIAITLADKLSRTTLMLRDLA